MWDEVEKDLLAAEFALFLASSHEDLERAIEHLIAAVRKLNGGSV